MRGLRVELVRLRSRRAVKLLVVLGLLGVLAVIGIRTFDAIPPSEADRAAAQAMVDEEIARPEFQQMLAECEAGKEAGDTDRWPADMNCAEAFTPKAEWYLGWNKPDYLDLFTMFGLATALILTLLLGVAGVTSAGGEWSTGTIGTQLLFESRRGRLYASKAGAMAVLAVVVGVVGIALSWIAAYWIASAWGSTSLLEYDDTGQQVAVTMGTLIGRAVRAVALMVAGAVGGYALAMLLRSSVAAISLIAGYALVAEAVLRGLFRNIEPYLLSTQLSAFLAGEHTVTRWPDICTGMCEPERITITAAQGGLVLGVLLAVIVAVSVVLFRRRDVA